MAAAKLALEDCNASWMVFLCVNTPFLHCIQQFLSFRLVSFHDAANMHIASIFEDSYTFLCAAWYKCRHCGCKTSPLWNYERHVLWFTTFPCHSNHWSELNKIQIIFREQGNNLSFSWKGKGILKYTECSLPLWKIIRCWPLSYLASFNSITVAFRRLETPEPLNRCSSVFQFKNWREFSPKINSVCLFFNECNKSRSGVMARDL